jgi:hypothetical protein
MMIGKCPVCHTDLRVSELSCPACRTKIVGDLATCEFCNLDEESRAFLRAFLRARGNIKAVEKDLGLSYPTVRKRLDQLLETLNLETSAHPGSMRRMDILNRLEAGDITVKEALRMLESGSRETENGR